MRIIVDTALNFGSAEYCNMGDVAMLQVAVHRLQRLWPFAQIEVLTECPAKLAVFCPGAKPLPRSGRDLWIGDNAIIGGFSRFLSPKMFSRTRDLNRAIRLQFPAAFRLLANLRLTIRDRKNVRPDVKTFLNAMGAADLFVVCGAGGFTNTTRDWNSFILNTMEEAIHRHIPVVLFGQGLGPLNDPEIVARARKILPKTALIALRGGRSDLAVARSLGLKPHQIAITGDEAVEIAYGAREEEPGAAVGINVRMASYSNVDGEAADELKPVLHEFARRHNAPLVPVPIAFHAWANDNLAIQRLLNGFDDSSDGGRALDTPLKVIRQIGRCRIVVTGAYHAAVFALAQGIPVVALCASEYYKAKFCGLAEQFGLGCEIVFMGKAHTRQALASALERAWTAADSERLPLREAARRQIALSQGAYNRVAETVAASSKPARQGELQSRSLFN